MPNASSVQRRQQQHKNKNGIKIGCFRVCTCIHLDFLTSKSGMLKLFELLLGSCCETLLINFGMQASAEIGKAFHGFLTTVTACLTTTFVLCLCYVLSSRSYNLIRQSLFVRIIINQNQLQLQPQRTESDCNGFYYIIILLYIFRSFYSMDYHVCYMLVPQAIWELSQIYGSIHALNFFHLIMLIQL